MSRVTASAASSLYTVRPATPVDRAAIRRLLSHSWRVYLPVGSQWLDQRLGTGECWVMMEGGREVAGIMAMLKRHPEVASIVGAAVRNGLPASLYAGMALPYLETYGRRQRVRGLACLSGATWLSETLSTHGFQTREHVITYGWDAKPLAVAGNTAVTVEPVRYDDLETIAAIDQQIFAPVWHKPRTEMEYTLGRADYFVTAKHENRIVGYCWSEQDGTHGHLTRLGVAKDWQGKGVGTRLLTEALVEMMRAGVTWVTLNTQASNWRARRLYEHYGFRRVGQAMPLLWKDLEGLS